MTYSKITISGRICTGKTTLFWLLQKKLGWPTFSASQYFRDYARTHGVSLQKAEEQNPSLTRDVDFSMKVLLQKEAHVIIEGWMAGIMANKLPGVLRILLTCNDDERMKRLAKRDGVREAEARKKIIEREKSWIAKLVQIYKRGDFFDPQNYNLIIDTTNNAPQQTLNFVLQALGYYANGK